MSQSKRRRVKERRTQATPQVIELRMDELTKIVERTRSATLSVEEHAQLKTAIDTLTFVTAELKAKKTSLERLRQMLFGSTTEKTRRVLKNAKSSSKSAREAKPAGEKKPGHGQNAAAAYTGAKKVKVPHASLCAGECCPECLKGKVYPVAQPAVMVRITGVAPLAAAVYERDRWRCNLCGEVFTAAAPAGVGEKKYDETATAMVGLFKYGVGLPFNRVEKLQAGMGIPLPATTQWGLVQQGAGVLAPVYQELNCQAAQGEVLYNDDTTMKVLALTKEQRAAAAADEEIDERTGVFTSGIVSTRDEHHIALFFTGVRHAGENLAAVLARRSSELGAPIQMCDALSHNTCGDFETIVANCIAHARRKFVEVAEDFPDECRHVLETLRAVYEHEATARERKLSAEERLAFHQSESGPLLADLEGWMKAQLEECKVEPNSELGKAMSYSLKHWPKLTLFLRVAGAPLDNNICERILKKAILHRKNALFYKTLNGAGVGDIFMSLIHTAELNDVEPFGYLVALLRHPEQIATAPADWMPWSYNETLARLSPATTMATASG